MMDENNPGLFLCGEVLDVDCVCGGYNLQWAFSSGYLAGVSSSAYIRGMDKV
jgi:predicted flavoprotein YhiN